MNVDVHGGSCVNLSCRDVTNTPTYIHKHVYTYTSVYTNVYMYKQIKMQTHTYHVKM
jgi:hypothetical protein